MKKIIVGTFRSGSTLLLDIESNKDTSLINLGEYYLKSVRKELGNIKQLTITLFNEYSHFIHKMHGYSLYKGKGQIEDLQLNKYDEIVLLERDDFWTQCCSWQVAADTEVWVQRKSFKKNKYQNFREQTCAVSFPTIFRMAIDKLMYNQIKEYVFKNNLKHIVVDYIEVASSQQAANSNIIENNYNYETMITNYNYGRIITDVALDYIERNAVLTEKSNFKLEILNILK